LFTELLVIIIVIILKWWTGQECGIEKFVIEWRVWLPSENMPWS